MKKNKMQENIAENLMAERNSINQYTTKENIARFLEEEEGIGVVEIILILVILVALVLLFKDQIEAIVKNAFDAIKKDSDKII